MGSDDTHVTDSVLPVQEPESASASKTTPSDGSGGADGSGASRPSSRRHQEQVQDLKDKRDNFMDGPMGTDGNLIDETKVPDKELGSASVASMESDCADPTPSDNSGGGGGSGAPCLWSLSQEEHVRNLKNNCKRVFYSRYPMAWARTEVSPWFARVVAQLRADPCLDRSQLEMKEAPFHLVGVGPLHLVVLMGDLEMVQKILETLSRPNKVDIDALVRWKLGSRYSTLDLAIVCGESEIVDALLEKNAKVDTFFRGSLQLAVLHTRAGQTENTFKIIQSLVRKGIDINAKDSSGFSAFYLAVIQEKTEIVNELLSKWENKIHLNEACHGGRPPIQIAHEEGFKDIENMLMQCNDVKWFIDTTIRERQGFVDTSNSILVGAAFIASATFASWLQPPLNYTTSYHGSSVEYVDVEHNVALGWFWVFNTLSFSFAIGTVVLGASSVLPRRGFFITENVKKLSQNLIVTSILLAFSMLFVVIAFGIAGLIVLIPILRYQWYMIVPMILGGIVCVGSIGYLFKSLWENRPWNIRRRKRNRWESNDIDDYYFI